MHVTFFILLTDIINDWIDVIRCSMMLLLPRIICIDGAISFMLISAMSQAGKDRFRNNPAKRMSLFLIMHPNSPDLN